MTAILRPGPCQHPAISDEALRERERLYVVTAGDIGALRCPDCGDYLYIHDDGTEPTVRDEPQGVGR